MKGMQGSSAHANRSSIPSNRSGSKRYETFRPHWDAARRRDGEACIHCACRHFWRRRTSHETSERKVVQGGVEAPSCTPRHVRRGVFYWRSAPQASLLRLAQKLGKRLWPHRWLFAVAVAQVLLIGALELLKPWPLKLIVDHVLAGHPVSWVWLAFLHHRRFSWLAV